MSNHTTGAQRINARYERIWDEYRKQEAMKDASLYEAITDACIPTGSHESDLYFKATPQALEILARYPLQKSNATYFTCQAAPNIGERWVDVPFAYAPFWEKVAARARKAGQ